MKKKTEIQQIDFYGILSEESTPLPDPAPVPTSIVQLNTPEHLDLDIRSQINGYLNSVEKNQAREIIGHEHIPLRSIRVPIAPKLSSAWAPNGYGKTYIFTHMQDLSNSFKGFDSSSESFSVAIIPYTYENTNFKTIKSGSFVNLEFDILGKYIAKIITKKD